jgi:membrane-associated PAP2 superfamily phosphatase
MIVNSGNTRFTSRFWLFHLFLPLAVLIGLAAVFEFTDIDIRLSSHFYDAAARRWPWREEWLTEKVIHKGGRYFVYTLGVILLGLWLWSFRAGSRFHSVNRRLAYLVVASVTGPLVVTLLKGRTHIHCPWNLTLFGGSKPYIRLLDSVPSGMTVGHCFPSGHSVLGFTFVGLYFFFLQTKPKFRYAGLCAGLLWGLFYGVNQQVRGAHFLSHDLYSLAICWFSAVLLYWLFFRKQQAE